MPSLGRQANLSRKSSVSEKSSLVTGADADTPIVETRPKTINYGSVKDDKDPESQKKKEAKPKRTPVFSLYRYATKLDLLLLLVGTLAAIATGAGLPLISIFFGNIANTFILAQVSPINPNWHPPSLPPGLAGIVQNISQFINGSALITREEFEASVMDFTLMNIYVGLAVMVAVYLMATCWSAVCERQMYRIRKEFFSAILRQDMTWFDSQQSGELTSRLSHDLDRVKEGIGDKMGIFFQAISTFLSGYIVAFTMNWKLSLVMLSVMPIIIVLGALFSKVIVSSSRREQDKYAKSGGVAEEVISCIRTVIAFNGQEKEIERYRDALALGKSQGIRKQMYTGLNIGFMLLFIFSSYALAFWYGAVLIRDGQIERGNVFTVFMCVLFGSMSLSQAGPQMSSLAIAQGAASKVFDIIDNRPEIDPYSEDGEKPIECKGQISFKNVEFSYPSRADVKIFKNVSIDVQPGEKVALVGPSGCGKSTAVNLLMRFYDPSNGQILLDGKNIRSLNLRWLRNTIGLVSQEPVLFHGTVSENIHYGNPDVTERDMIAAAKASNAHNFIMQLPKGYETLVGERGTQLSGGQKQRVAIARSLVRNPMILLLDEATSALDAESEGIVQEALDKAKEGRTTITIAHRLSTIRNADKIIAIQDGNIEEVGTHDELMKKHGTYYELVMAQTFEDVNDVTKDGDENEADDDLDALPALLKQVSRQSSSPRKKTTSFSDNISEKSFGSNASLLRNRKKSDKGPKTPVRMLSKPKNEKDRLKEEIEAEGVTKSNLTQILEHAKPEWMLIVLGLVAGAIRGAVMPAFAFVYSEIFNVYTKNGDDLVNSAAVESIWFVVIGFINFIGIVGGIYFLGKAGENFTMRLRLSTFKNILRMDGAYFDDEKRSTGKLCTRLATDASAIRTAFDFRFSAVLSSAVSMVAGIVIGFVYGWQLACLVLVFLPVLGLGSFVNFKLRHGNTMRDTMMLEDAGKVAAEAIENIKTVQYLTRERVFYQKFADLLLKPYETQMRTCHINGVGYAFAQSVFYFLYAASFRFGGFLVLQGVMEPTNVTRVFNSIVFASSTIGFATAYFGEYAKARLCSALLFKMLNERPQIDSFSQNGLRPDVLGKINFKGVSFFYPTRPNIEVLKGIDFAVEPGKTLALVGQSGCGKSTAVSLMERLYDPYSGAISLDDFELKTLNIRYLRDQISIVSQEPVLFDTTIRDNIAYGLDTEDVNEEAVVDAAKAANIHEFITSLPDTYNTKVGEKGTQLSGGQKQRVAIARALIRKPKILLLDEATSALDTESEKIVQEALDRARKGRTVIIIAHRLSTVQSADVIAVIKDGKIVEQGTHNELISKRGVYFELTKKQNLDATN